MRVGLMAFVVVTLAGTAGAAGNVARIQRSEKPFDGKPEWTLRSQTAFLGEASVCLVQTLKDGKAVEGKGTKYNFGLQLGRRPGYNNGSWDIWDFFTCFRPVRNTALSVTRGHAAESFALSTCGEAKVLDAVFPAGEDGARLEMRFFAFPSHPKWVFARFRTVGFTPMKWKLSCYPANTKTVPARELWATYRGGAANLGRDGMDIANPTMNAFLLHHRYADEQDGDKLVFFPEEVVRVTANKSSLQASLYFTPKKNVNEFHCAFGYYWDEPLTDISWRFPDEEAGVIAAYMKTIDWDAKPDPQEVANEIRRLKALGAPKERLREFADAFKADREDAVKLSTLGERVDAYRDELVNEGLKEFK